MNNKYFVEKRENKKIAKKYVQKEDVKLNILKKMIPIAIMFLLTLGVANIIGTVNTDSLLKTNEINEATAVIKEDEKLYGILTELPIIVEKSVFEGLLKDIPERVMLSGIDASYENIIRKMKAYYSIGYLDREFYVLDPTLYEREKSELLGYWNEYIGWDDTAYHKMLLDYNIIDSKFIRYSHAHTINGAIIEIMPLSIK